MKTPKNDSSTSNSSSKKDSIDKKALSAESLEPKLDMPTDFKIKIKGKKKETLVEKDLGRFVLKDDIDMVSTRSEESKTFVYNGQEIGLLTFEDGTEWIAYLGDMPEVYADEAISRGDAAHEFFLPNTLNAKNSDRGIFKSIFTAIGLKVFSPAISRGVNEIIKSIDKKVVEKPGLYLIDKNFIKTPFDFNKHATGKILLLLHGVLSNSESAFDGLKGNAELFNLYENVLVYDHYTLQQDPIQNALELLEVLPKGCTIDLLSHSRGGLVGDILSRCDSRNRVIGFTLEEVNVLSSNGEVNASDLQKLNQIALEKEIKIQRFIRVACPAGGTTLLSNRLDHYLNALLNTFGAVSGLTAFPLYNIIKELLLEIVNCRANAESIPGLWAMTPASSYQSINNNRAVDVKPELFVVAGDAEGSWNIFKNTAQTLKVILTNLFYLHANDFAVDTKSMKKGMSRAEGLYLFISQSINTNHFNYFSKDEKAKAAVFLALRGGTYNSTVRFEKISKDQMDRGVGLSLTFNHYAVDTVKGEQPIAIILPGIMGSTLQDSKDDIWVNFVRIARGEMVNKLKIDDPNISASGAIAKYYSELGEILQERNELKVFAFDWRKSLTDAANELSKLIEVYLSYNQPITIVAHSMGGLVAKHLIFHHPDLWEKFKRNAKNKLILLGTPWRGSHLIMEVLTGHSSKLKQLGSLDIAHKRTTILKEVAKYPGLLELLPLDESGFSDQSLTEEKKDFEFKGYDDKSFWDFIRAYALDTIDPDSGFQDIITKFRTQKNPSGTSYLDFKLSDNDLNYIYYIAGNDDTIFGCKIKNSFFKGKHLVYISTRLGDGSVTWDLGIPKELSKEKLYFSQVNHTNLSNDKSVFDAIIDIIDQGSTSRLPREAPQSRAGDMVKEVVQIDQIAANEDELLDIILGVPDQPKDSIKKQEPIKISVLNADLKYTHYPVMVGHFKGDGLFSAEKALDHYLNGKLSERHRLGYYPNEIIESEITYNGATQPKGVLIIGLGIQSDLTSYQLSLSVEKAVIKYAFFFRDNYELAKNKKYAKGISAILIGSAYGGLPVESCIQAILTGVQKANDCIRGLKKGLVPIENIEFVDYFEDKAQQCYLSLKKLELDYNQYNISVQKFVTGIGSKRRIVLNDNASWWHTISTTTVYWPNATTPNGLIHNLSDGKARVEQSNVCSDLRVATYLTEQFSESARWDPKLSKTLFELLIPNQFKSVIKNQNNIIWKIDEYAAQFPWEMFHDYIDERNTNNQIPTFVNTGIVRQFITEHYRVNPVIVDQRKALVVGDPDYKDSGFGDLPGAAQEAKLVTMVLEKNNYEVLSLINSKATTIIKELFADAYRMIHFAAHGVYERIGEGSEQRARAGIVLGDGLFLEPCTINQLSAIPEFIFINCCYSGTIKPEDEKYYKYRPSLAANIGIQLIEMGVKSIIVTGWAVDDAAANTFAEEFYKQMFEGYEFGQAVKFARRQCYEKYPNSNTWGAYQCYGDPYFKLTNKNPTSAQDNAYITVNQAIVELENQLSILKGQRVNINEQLEKLALIKKRVDGNNLENSTILEHYALVYAELGQYAPSVAIFDELLETEHADFTLRSIEQHLSLKSKLLLHKSNNQLAEKGLIRNEINQLIAKLNMISNLGITAERLYILGAMHRRASMILNGPTEKEKQLQLMYEQYRRAYDCSTNRSIDNLAYSLSNFIFANHFLKEGKLDFNTIAIPDFKKENQSLKEALIEKISQLEEIEENLNTYYSRIAKAKLYSCLLILEEDEIEEEDYYNGFHQTLISDIYAYGNMKNIMGEQEHLMFLMNQFSKDSSKYKKLQNIDTMLSQILLSND
ncbi:MAG TPA: CHAT domain-containing protein [Edaphocola sp.]|nr:CHAT domain-containing protein [Edaphocola sp.]